MSGEYDLKSVKLPRLAGAALSAFVGLVENPLTGGSLLGQLLENGGITGLRQVKVDEAPTPAPAPPPSCSPFGETALPAPPTAPAPGGFRYPTSRDYTAAYRSGKLSPVETAERAAAAIEANREMNLFIAWRKEEILDQGRAAAERWQAGRPLGPLDGVPVAIKDELDQAGFPTTAGTAFLGGQAASADATVVARLRAAGAILVGKTNMHEIGIGVTGHNSHYGPAHNPHNPGHHTGGSSSGSAAAVAAGLCPAALGADGGGSVRLPAALCGVIGLKPTFGRVSEQGAAPLCWSVAHIGPLAATAYDAALILALIAGPDPLDDHTLRQPPLDLARWNQADLGGLKLGVYWPWFRHAEAEVTAVCEGMVETFRRRGAEIVEITLPDLEAARVAHLITITSEMNAALDRYYAQNHKQYSLEVRLNLALARSFKASDYIQAQRVRTRTIRNFEKALVQVDAILSPTSGVAAPSIRPDSLPAGDSDLSLLTEIMRFTPPANFTGHPAISFPAGYTAAGLPVGMQAIGRYWREDTLLQLAYAAENELETRKPSRYLEVLHAVLS